MIQLAWVGNPDSPIKNHDAKAKDCDSRVMDRNPAVGDCDSEAGNRDSFVRNCNSLVGNRAPKVIFGLIEVMKRIPVVLFSMVYAGNRRQMALNHGWTWVDTDFGKARRAGILVERKIKEDSSSV
jgi:hypothetical protein